MSARRLGGALAAMAMLAACALPLATAADESEQAAERIRQKYPALKAVNAPGLRPVTDQALERVLPGYRFFSAIPRQYPVARAVPRGLKLHNLFAVKDEHVDYLTGARDLQTFCRAHLKAVTGDQMARAAARAWLTLTPEFIQDGYYGFTVQADSLKVKRTGTDRQATGKTVVMRGGNGQIEVRMLFDRTGKLVRATETVKVRPGPRPICQATKLLDPDPIVRRMAEQDLRIMGRAAREYVMEQRARAGPELRQAIDRLWQQILAEPE